MTKLIETSHKSSRGVGIVDGLEILGAIKEKFNCPVISDVYENQIDVAKTYLDIIQIPAFLCRTNGFTSCCRKLNYSCKY